MNDRSILYFAKLKNCFSFELIFDNDILSLFTGMFVLKMNTISRAVVSSFDQFLAVKAQEKQQIAPNISVYD